MALYPLHQDNQLPLFGAIWGITVLIIEIPCHSPYLQEIWNLAFDWLVGVQPARQKWHLKILVNWHGFLTWSFLVNLSVCWDILSKILKGALKFHTKYLPHTLKDVFFIQCWKMYTLSDLRRCMHIWNVPLVSGLALGSRYVLEINPTGCTELYRGFLYGGSLGSYWIWGNQFLPYILLFLTVRCY